MIPKLEGRQSGRFISRGYGRHISRTIDTWELILVLGGRLGMFCGTKTFTLYPGDWLLMPPGIRHGGTVEYPKNLSFFWIHFLPCNPEAEEFLRGCPRTATRKDFARLSEYLQLYNSLESEFPTDREAMDALCGLILHEATRPSRNAPEVPSGTPPVPDLLYRLEHMLRLRYREPLSTGALAAELGCNPDYLGRIFHRFRGHSIGEELHNQRIIHAMDLLRYSPLTVKQILYDIGYNDPVHFRKQFFRRLAMTPRDYRRLKTEKQINTE